MTDSNNERMIKGRLFVYWVEVPDMRDTSKKFLQERLAHYGDVVTIPRDEDLALGEREGMFYSENEREAIEAGTYRGLDSASVAAARHAGTIPAPSSASAVDPDMEYPLLTDGSLDVEEATDEEIAGWIAGGSPKGSALNVNETLALAGDDAEFAEKVLDAEAIASNNRPRQGVSKGLEEAIARRTTG